MSNGQPLLEADWVSGARRQFDVFAVRYIPNILDARFVNIGVLVTERDHAGFADCRFLREWQSVRCFDPDADVEMLNALTQEIEDAWRQPSERAELLERMVTSFSSAIQLSLEETIETDNPTQELRRMTAMLL